MYIFLTKTNKTFIDQFFKPYLDFVNIQNYTNIIILTKNNNQNRNFHWNNIKNYNKGKKTFKSVEDFFETIWGIPLFKMKRKRKKSESKKVIRRRIVKSRKVE